MSTLRAYLSVQGAQANLNDIKGGQPHETPASGSHPASETGTPPPRTQEGSAAQDPQAVDLNKVKDGLSKVGVFFKRVCAFQNYSRLDAPKTAAHRCFCSLLQIDLHAAINVSRDLEHGNMRNLATDAAKLKKGKHVDRYLEAGKACGSPQRQLKFSCLCSGSKCAASS